MLLPETDEFRLVVFDLLRCSLVTCDQLVVAACLCRAVISRGRRRGTKRSGAYQLPGVQAGGQPLEWALRGRGFAPGFFCFSELLDHAVVDVLPYPGPADLRRVGPAVSVSRTRLASAATSAANGASSSGACDQLAICISSSGDTTPSSTTAFTIARVLKKSSASQRSTFCHAERARPRATSSRSAASARTLWLPRWSLSRPTNRATRRPPMIATRAALVATMVDRNGAGSVGT